MSPAPTLALHPLTWVAWLGVAVAAVSLTRNPLYLLLLALALVAEEVLQALVRLNEDLGLTVVLVEHRVERVLPLADQVLAVDPAGGVSAGPPRTVLGQVAHAPPVVAVARAYGWSPLPLSVKEARPFAAAIAPARQQAPASPPQPRSGPPYLEVANFEAGYGAAPVLSGVSLSVWPGEIAVLMGRNGVGKSTLLRCIVGLLRPRRGSVRVAGRVATGRPVAELSRLIACLPQESDSLLFADSVAEELRVTLRNHDRLRRARWRSCSNDWAWPGWPGATRAT